MLDHSAAPRSGRAHIGIAAASLLAASLAAIASAGAEAFDVERYLNIRSAALTGLSPDAKTVAYTTNVTGSAQIWTIPASGGWPEQITFYRDRVSDVEWSPGGDWIAFSKDNGGDENFQLHLVTPDGANLVALTSDPTVRNGFGAFSRDGKRISYSSNARNRKFFDIYVMDLQARRPEPVVQKDGFWSAAQFSDDGRRLIVSRLNGSLDNDLFVVDLSKGAAAEPVLLTPHQGIARFTPIGWAGEKAVWILSDVDREFVSLGKLDVESRKITWVREPKWDVAGAEISPDGRRLAFVTNEDGLDVLGLLDTATSKDLPAPKIRPGQIGGLKFSNDGRVLAFTLSAADINGDVWMADLGSGALTRVTRSSTAGIPPSSFVAPRLIRYKTFDGLDIPAFLYAPKGTEKGAPAGAGERPSAGLPCIVNPHGGPEGQTVASFSAVTQYYVNRGYAVLQPNVRGSTGYGKTFTHLDDVRKREDSVKDLAAAVTWLKESRIVDPKRVAVLGGSYGGYMTLAAVTLYPDLWAAAVDSFGIANFRTFFGKTASYRVGMRASEYGDPEKDADFLDSISPIHKVDRIQAPLLVLQGANDPRVPQVEAEQIVAAIKNKGGVVEYVLFPDEGHGWSKLGNQVTAYRTTADFLDRHLKGTGDKGGASQ